MNLASRSQPSVRRMKKVAVPLALSWSHGGINYRVTPWPEVQFERLYGEEWIPALPTDDVFASAAQAGGTLAWQPYLEFVPGDVRELLARFSFTRMEALLVAARCPALLPTLQETPALTAFVASHMALRGADTPRWDEINAVYERSDIFGVLEWLGLPASRQTLSILDNLADPDVPKRFLEPLRAMLWEPRAIFALQRMTGITDRVLARYCHALAA
jgi:hypothetical protein